MFTLPPLLPRNQQQLMDEQQIIVQGKLQKIEMEMLQNSEKERIQIETQYKNIESEQQRIEIQQLNVETQQPNFEKQQSNEQQQEETEQQETEQQETEPTEEEKAQALYAQLCAAMSDTSTSIASPTRTRAPINNLNRLKGKLNAILQTPEY